MFTRKLLNLFVVIAILLSTISFDSAPARASSPSPTDKGDRGMRVYPVYLPDRVSAQVAASFVAQPAAFSAAPEAAFAQDASSSSGDPDWTSHEADDVRAMARTDLGTFADASAAATGLSDTPVWTSIESDDSCGLAWGDYDNDGDLDLVFANRNAPLRLYRNDDGMLTRYAAWSSPEVNNSCDVAWGDYDHNGYLDLAVANMDLPDRVYGNDKGELAMAWETPWSEDTRAVAWGDPDFDGYLELATTSQDSTTRIYKNQNGHLTFTSPWRLEDKGIDFESIYRTPYDPYSGGYYDNFYWGIAAIGPHNAWIVGGVWYPPLSLIKYTNDGGVTWSQWTSETEGFLHDADFVDEQTGWAVGTSGTILHTTDGGQTWNSQQTTTTLTLRDVEFIDAQTGWIAGDDAWRYEEQGSNHIILNTTDGGATWQTQHTGNGSGLRAVTFIDLYNGWAVGQSDAGYMILDTGDGGATWNMQIGGSSGDVLEDVTFVNSQVGWAVGSHHDAECYYSRCPFMVHTRDGGVTWNNVPINGYCNTYYFWTLDAVDFVDENNGWAVGSLGSNSSGFALHTQDGGNSWICEIRDTTQEKIAFNFLDVTTSDFNTVWIIESVDRWYTGAGIFRTTGADFGRSLAWVDYDMDGDLDLSVGRYGMDDLIYRYVYTNGQYVFVPATHVLGQNPDPRITDDDIYLRATSKRTTTDLAWADFNGDEWDTLPDLATIEDGQVAIYTNTGKLVPALDQTFGSGYERLAWGEWFSGTSSVPALAAVGLDRVSVYEYVAYSNTFELVWEQLGGGSQDVAWGDYDDNSSLDLAVAVNGPNRLYHHTGKLHMSLAGVLSGYNTTHCTWGDYNGDQLLDYVCTRGYPFESSVYLNNGNGLDAGFSPGGGVLAAGDYDNDGDLD
ncbi:MAG: VCBS repeat-containing protein, partial [Thermoflexales bacterium]|nr:VCBS repeat-containing protein [Thermoflexales bacterium]